MFENALVAQFLTSTEPHAFITSIDVSGARAMPGVVDVVTGADLDLGRISSVLPDYPDAARRPILPTDRVLFVGQAIAAVVAETEAQAADALEQIIVEYDPLPPVVTLEDAASDETLLFPEVGTNVMLAESGGTDGPADFSDCEVVVEAEIINQRVAPAPIETRTSASLWTDEGRLVQYASCQGVHPLRAGLAAIYGLDESQVRVITADVGGSFGAKIRLYPEDIALPALARRAGRAVRWSPPRTLDMVGMGHSRGQRQRVKIGGDRDGTLKVIEVDLLAHCGAFPELGAALARNAARMQPGPFRMRAHWSLRCVVSNTTPIVAYRGAGRPEGGALIDRAVNRFAAEVGMDQVEIRRKNLLRAEELPTTNPTGVYLDSGDYPEALELLVKELDYDDLKAEQARRRASGTDKQLGIGISTFIDRTAGIPGSEYGSVELVSGGRLRVLTGSSPYGQGHYTTWAMLVADRTGVPFDQIEVFHGDTDIVPRGRITGGSRSVQKAGSAIALATEQLVEDARQKAADQLEAPVADVVLDVTSGRFHVVGSPGAASVGWAQIALALSDEQDAANDRDEYAGLRCEVDYEPEGSTAPYGAYGAVVEVDTETGAVDLIRMITVDDVGTVVNPMLALGQVHGGLAQAIGQALFEEFVYDDSGNPLTGNFLDYSVPSATELPPFECHLTEHPTTQNPLGAKGIAESGTIGGVPAVQNGVIDALAHLGVLHLDMPLTPLRVWRAINETSGRSLPIGGPASWVGSEIAHDTAWIHHVSDAEVAEIEAALFNAERSNKTMSDLGLADFPLPSLSAVLADVRIELEDGCGIKLLRGFPTDRFTTAQLRMVFWGLGLHVGTAVSQSSRNDYLGDVRDIGTGLDGPKFRGYTSNGDLTYHCDAADVTGLFCLHPAKLGGLSRIVSTAAIHDEILNTRPDLLEVLYRPFWWSMQGNELRGVAPFYTQPIFAIEDGHFAARYTRTHIRSAELEAETNPDIPALTAQQTEALTYIDEIAARSEFHLTMMFEPGDMQFLNNHLTLHTRTAFEDFPETERRRHLLRLWLSLPNGRPLAESFRPFFRDVLPGAVRGGFPGTGERQFTTL